MQEHVYMHHLYQEGLGMKQSFGDLFHTLADASSN